MASRHQDRCLADARRRSDRIGPRKIRHARAAPLERARRLAAQTGERLDRVAVKLGLLAERDLASVYAGVLGSPLATLADMPPELGGALSMPAKFLRHARTMPLGERQGGIEVAMADPFDAQSLRAMEFALSRPVLRRAAVPADIACSAPRNRPPSRPTG